MISNNSDKLSQHPVDLLIRVLIGTGRPARPEEIGEIIERIVTAPFDPHSVKVGAAERGTFYQGYSLSSRADALTYHLIKRVVLEQQWRDGTTAEQYLADLRAAGREAAVRLVVYERRGGHIAALIAPTSHVIPPERRGRAALPSLVVSYSADRGIILTGYQFSDTEKIGIPREARWLR